MKSIVKLSTFVFLSSLGFGVFAHTSHPINFTVSNSDNAGVFSVGQPTIYSNTSGYNAFAKCTSASNNVDCGVFYSDITGASLSFNVEYAVSTTSSPVNVGTLKYEVESGNQLSVTYTPVSDLKNLTCQYTGSTSPSDAGSTVSAPITCQATIPVIPTKLSYQNFSYSIALSGNAPFALATPAQSFSASWGQTNSQDNVMGNAMSLDLDSGKYTLSYDAIGSALSASNFNESAKFNLVFAPTSSANTTVSIPVTLTDNAGSYSMTPSSFSLGDYTTCTLGNSGSATDFDVDCTYAPPPVLNVYNYNVQVSGLPSGYALGNAAVTNPSWTSGGATTIGFSGGQYDDLFKATADQYKSAGSFVFAIPVLYNGTTAKNLTYTITKEANVITKPTATVSPATFTLPESDPANYQQCSAVASSSANDTTAVNFPLTISCSSETYPNDQYEYNVETTVTGAPMTLPTANLSAPDWANAPSTVSEVNNAYAIPLSVSHEHYTSDAGNVVLSVPVDGVKDPLVITLAKKANATTVTPTLSSASQNFDYTDPNTKNAYRCSATIAPSNSNVTVNNYKLAVNCTQVNEDVVKVSNNFVIPALAKANTSVVQTLAFSSIKSTITGADSKFTEAGSLPKITLGIAGEVGTLDVLPSQIAGKITMVGTYTYQYGNGSPYSFPVTLTWTPGAGGFPGSVAVSTSDTDAQPLVNKMLVTPSCNDGVCTLDLRYNG